MAGETREMLRRALLVALGLLLALPAAAGIFLLSENASAIWVTAGSLVAFFVGRMLINWIFLKS
jgi:hypothetical protein